MPVYLTFTPLSLVDKGTPFLGMYFESLEIAVFRETPPGSESPLFAPEKALS
jgi:hypothetical protein